MADNNLAVQYRKNFTDPSIVIGTITVALAMITSFLPNIYLYFAYGVFPDWEHLLTAWGNIVVMCGAFYIVEPVSYFPIFGLTGTYIGILSGNISQIRLPAAATAPVIGGEVILRLLPTSVTNAMSKFILPSLFGACFTTMAVKKMSITLYALPLALFLRYIAVPAWLCIIICIFGVLGITYTLYKAKIIR